MEVRAAIGHLYRKIIILGIIQCPAVTIIPLFIGTKIFITPRPDLNTASHFWTLPTATYISSRRYPRP